MRRALVLLTICWTLSAAPPALAVAPNDNLDNAAALSMYEYSVANNTGATVQPGEPLTMQDNVFCNSAGGASLSGWPMRSTLWYYTWGTGRTMTFSAFGSDVDTVLAVYDEDLNLVKCSDQVFDNDWSELRTPSQRDAFYVVQVGSACDTKTTCAKALGEGQIYTGVATQPSDDDAAHASRLDLGKQNTESLFGATEDPGETLTCGDAEYGKTRWFRVTAPTAGTLTVAATATNHDSVISVYQADGKTRLDCNDDGDGNTSSARVSVKVAAGDYLVQVGGYGHERLADADADFVLGADFTPATVVTPTPTPTATATPTPNPCAGPCGSRDADRDGVVGAPDGPDCNDGNPQIKPGAVDVPENGVDENCDGADGKRSRVLAQPKFRYVFKKRPARLQVVEVWVEGLEAGSTVSLRCSGRGCPSHRAATKTVSKATKSMRMNVRFEKRLRRAASITLTITHGDEIGTVRRLVVGDRKVEDRTLCLWPGERTARPCS